MLLKKNPCCFFIFTYLTVSIKPVLVDLTVAGTDGELRDGEVAGIDSVWDVEAVVNFFGHVTNL